MSRANGGWIQTFTGKQFWPLDPRPEDVCIEDVAHALANLCRYTGHTKTFYSVAEHCVRVSLIVDPELALWGLLHDASEAYLMDLPSPLKRDPEFGALYKKYEGRLMAVICEAFGLPLEEPPAVKVADRQLLVTEKRDLMRRPPKPWEKVEVGPLEDKIFPVTAREAEAWYLERFVRLDPFKARQVPAQEVRYEVPVYHVNGVVYIQVTTDQGPAAARQEAMDLVVENGPDSRVLLLPQLPKERYVAVLPGDFTSGGGR